MFRYDEHELVMRLRQVSPRLRGAFAAACAERQFPAYVEFSFQSGRRNHKLLGDILGRIWESLITDRVDRKVIKAEISLCMELVPGEDDEPWVEAQPYAEDAASAVAYALRTIDSGEAQEAASAAQTAYEAADHFVTHRFGVENEEEILGHPVVQAELSHQQRDLAELEDSTQGPATLVAELRDRARREAALFFQPA